jgi:nucleotide-binding universal stress UspA family protein
MLRIERILCPVDFSEISASTFGSAQSLARHYKAKLYLQHVVDFGLPYYEYYAPSLYLAEVLQTMRENAEKKLREFAKSHTSNGEEPECLVSDGWVTSAILSFADAQKVDLIVLGTHGVRGDDRGALGSVADKVLRKARCPVLVSRKREHPIAAASGTQGVIQLQRLLFCTDFSDPSRRALEYALSVAAEYDAEITLLHVLEEAQRPDKIEQVMATATRQLGELIPPEGGAGVKIKTAVRIGSAYEKIIQYATENLADLVIMAVRGRNALDLAVFGSTTYRVIQLGPCSVLAVHG